MFRCTGTVFFTSRPWTRKSGYLLNIALPIAKECARKNDKDMWRFYFFPTFLFPYLCFFPFSPFVFASLSGKLVTAKSSIFLLRKKYQNGLWMWKMFYKGCGNSLVWRLQQQQQKCVLVESTRSVKRSNARHLRFVFTVSRIAFRYQGLSFFSVESCQTSWA